MDLAGVVLAKLIADDLCEVRDPDDAWIVEPPQPEVVPPEAARPEATEPAHVRPTPEEVKPTPPEPDPPAPPLERFYSRREVAASLGVHPVSVGRWQKRGWLVGTCATGRWRFAESALADFVQRRPVILMPPWLVRKEAP